jgi:hypothetical protein
VTKIIRLSADGKRQISKDGGLTWTCESYKSELGGLSFPYIYPADWTGKVFDEPVKAMEWCDYKGKRCRVLSKNYQTGNATLEAHHVTGPYTIDVKLADITLENPRALNKCTCGVDKVGEGRHSDWCDKFFKG